MTIRPLFAILIPAGLAILCDVTSELINTVAKAVVTFPKRGCMSTKSAAGPLAEMRLEYRVMPGRPYCKIKIRVPAVEPDAQPLIGPLICVDKLPAVLAVITV
jgi:hypothetical protein